MAYWANFATTADPNGAATATRRAGSGLQWPSYTQAARWPTQMLWTESDGGVGPVRGLHTADCAFWGRLWSNQDAAGVAIA
eukprot:3111641-Prymnesium_polylepis.1